ncbi:MAG: DMT family transporter [Proteobacteria bacterium]|nr:DMT family transporter [Pseudomonadota bacterium]
MQGHQHHVLKGAAFMVAAMFTFCVVNVVVKDTAGSFPILQLVFFRNFLAIIPCYLIFKSAGRAASLKTRHMPTHLLCGSLGVLALYCLFTSFHVLPLADATAFSYTSILFVTLFSYVILKEHLDAWRVSAVALGFMGVLIMAKPSGDVLHTGIFYSLVFAAIDAFVMVSARRLTKDDHPAVVVFYFACVASFVSALFLPFGNWVTPDGAQLLKLCFLGLGGGFAQFLLTQAFRHAPAVVVAPLTYTSLVWSVLFGAVLWGDFPTQQLLAGCALVMACGCFMTWREHKKQSTFAKDLLLKNRARKKVFEGLSS